MATIVRTTWTNGTTVINNAQLQAIYDALDTALRAVTTITPATITSNQNNYNPTGLSTSDMLRLATDASRTITGIQAQAGRRLIIANAGVQNIVFAHQSASSTATNRINCTGGVDLTLGPTETLEFVYDDSSGVWRTIAWVP